MIENAELIAIIALLGTLFISAVGAAFALGGLPRRGEFNEMRKEVGALRQEMNDKIDASNKELSDKIEESNKELKAELIAEIRRSHQQPIARPDQPPAPGTRRRTGLHRTSRR